MTEPASSAPEWDLDLPKARLSDLSPSDKRLRTSASLRRKVELLERWALDGSPPVAGLELFGDRAKLRRKHDEALRLWRWSDTLIDTPTGRNAELMARFSAAVAAIRAPPRLDKASALRRQLREQEALVIRLERQNARLVDEIRRLQRSVVQPARMRR